MFTTARPAIAAMLALGATTAHAATYNFSYDFGFTTLTGTLQGTLQSDSNTVVVTAVDDFVSFHGLAAPSLPVVTTLATFVGSGATAPRVTFDGSVVELLACSNSSCSQGFYLDNSAAFGAPVVSVNFPLGFSQAPYVAAKWTLSPTGGAVPEPASWALMIVGFGMVGATMRRRKALAA